MLGGDDRAEFGQHHPADVRQIALTLQHAAELGEVRLQPVLLGVLLRGVAEVADHLVDRVREGRDFALRLDHDRPRQVALGHGRGDLGDGPHLRREVGGQLVHVLGECLPDTGRTGHLGLAAELPFDADLAGHRRHLIGERGERVDHFVDRLGEFGDFALRFDGELPLQVAVGDGGHDLGDAADLGGQVAGHAVDGVGQVFPRAGDAFDLGLPAELAFGAHFAGHARHFAGERPQLIDHRVDGVLQFENFALHIDGDLAGQVAGGDGLGHVGDVAHLSSSGCRP